MYVSWYAERGLPAPPPGIRGILLAEGELLVSGMMLYSTDGPYTLFEHFAVNPRCKPKLAHRAAKMTLAIAEGLCAMEGKTPLVLAGKKGIVALLEQAGFKRQEGLGVFSLEDHGPRRGGGAPEAGQDAAKG